MAKRRTTVEKVNKRVTLSKIVKFTYLQSLALDGGLTSAGELGGTTEGTSGTSEDGTSTSNLISKIAGPQSLGSKLFGKKTTVTTKTDYKETGWTLTKVWNQPQFDIIRYAIGIKELTVAQFTYEQTSEIVSKPWGSPKEIVKLVLNVDQFIPSNFVTGDYIEYFVRPNIQDFDWIRINPIGLPSVFGEGGNVIPRIINFNTEKPLSSRFEDAYFFTTSPVKEVIFRAVLKRPDVLADGSSAEGFSPILRSYRLNLIPRNGL
jgi:hypothetical protein